MSCSQFDLKGFFLEELSPAEKQQVREHVESCPACEAELDRLRLTKTALLSLREEEPPRRIAFVSDKVFEPSWWGRVWQSGPRLGFASAALLAAAIIFHGFPRPAPVTTPAGVNMAAIEARIETTVAQRLDAALAASEARQASRLALAMAETQKHAEFQRASDRVAVEEAFTRLEKRMNVRYLASNDLGAGQ